jgi:hypothetical protein
MSTNFIQVLIPEIYKTAILLKFFFQNFPENNKDPKLVQPVTCPERKK